VIFLLFGSSGSGKTAALEAVRGRLPGLPCHDFDEIGVPSDADRRWRQEANEAWLKRALAYRAEGLDILLAGQTPFGELLATPSAAEAGPATALLLDCSDDVRRARLELRGVGPPLPDLLSWASWLRGHAADPRWRPDVICDDAWEQMRWERWSGWESGDPRWRVRILDTSELTLSDVAERVVAWIEDERAVYGTL
jgi:hypothetical protein